jgi:MOSC domain
MPVIRSGDNPGMRVASVNVGKAVKVTIAGRSTLTAIGKRAVTGPVGVRPLGLDGDEQADLSVHGGLSKAVYAYPSEHYAFWRTVRAQAGVGLWDDVLPPGSLGENLTLEGVVESRPGSAIGCAFATARSGSASRASPASSSTPRWASRRRRR